MEFCITRRPSRYYVTCDLGTVIKNGKHNLTLTRIILKLEINLGSKTASQNSLFNTNWI